MLTITRAEALYALAVAPFVVALLVGIAVACTYTFTRERRDYFSPDTQRRRAELHERAAKAAAMRGRR